MGLRVLGLGVFSGLGFRIFSGLGFRIFSGLGLLSGMLSMGKTTATTKASAVWR